VMYRRSSAPAWFIMAVIAGAIGGLALNALLAVAFGE
jgi:hypothetical protein